MGKLNILLILWVGLSVMTPFAEAEEKEKFVYNEQDSRDPMWPLVGSAGNVISYDSDFMLTDLVLEGIMSGDSKSGIAMINGKIVGINDKIGQFVIVHINSNEVVLQKGDQQFKLRLKKEE